MGCQPASRVRPAAPARRVRRGSLGVRAQDLGHRAPPGRLAVGRPLGLVQQLGGHRGRLDSPAAARPAALGHRAPGRPARPGNPAAAHPMGLGRLVGITVAGQPAGLGRRGSDRRVCQGSLAVGRVLGRGRPALLASGRPGLLDRTVDIPAVRQVGRVVGVARCQAGHRVVVRHRVGSGPLVSTVRHGRPCLSMGRQVVGGRSSARVARRRVAQYLPAQRRMVQRRTVRCRRVGRRFGRVRGRGRSAGSGLAARRALQARRARQVAVILVGGSCRRVVCPLVARLLGRTSGRARILRRSTGRRSPVIPHLVSGPTLPIRRP